MTAAVELKPPPQQDPVVLSYAALRRAVGIVAIALPFLVSIPAAFFCHEVKGSISDYYYTCMGHVFTGSLCAIGLFMFCCRGYDRQDVIASQFSALCAAGVAFFPCEGRAQWFHYGCAALLFATLAYFCLGLFTQSRGLKTLRKIQRNRIYIFCGWGIILSMAVMAIHTIAAKAWSDLGPPPPKISHITFIFETTSLLCFGIAWLIKGEAILKDPPQQAVHAHTRTTSTLLALDLNPDPDPPHNLPPAS